MRELQPYVGRVIEAKIIELDRNRNNVVLSRRTWLEEAQKEQRSEFLTNLKPGVRRHGVVSSVVNFGAFVDLGGMDGLIHVSELSWKHIDHPSSVVQVGDEVEVEVLDVDLDKERISLSLKATQTDPWQEFADTHEVGQLVYGRITKLVPFGSFVQVGDGIEGLVHISEMAAHHVDLPEQVVNPGEELWVKIIDIDLQRRRISLSIKQAAEGGEVSEEYREAFGEHAYDDEGNYIGSYDYAADANSPPRPRPRPPGPTSPASRPPWPPRWPKPGWRAPRARPTRQPPPRRPRARRPRRPRPPPRRPTPPTHRPSSPAAGRAAVSPQRAGRPGGNGRPRGARARSRAWPAARWRSAPRPGGSGSGIGSPTVGRWGWGARRYRAKGLGGASGSGSGTALEQGGRVVVGRRPIEGLGRGHLAELAQVHDGHPVAHVLHHRQVVGDEEQRERRTAA